MARCCRVLRVCQVVAPRVASRLDEGQLQAVHLIITPRLLLPVCSTYLGMPSIDPSSEWPLHYSEQQQESVSSCSLVVTPVSCPM
jgi:hypothetical protein